MIGLELDFPARSPWWCWFLDPTQAVWAQLMNKRQRVNVLYYVNIRFIANVQSYPNTIVNNCFEDTLQQQYRYLYKTHRNFLH